MKKVANYRRDIDGLRAIAVLSVVLHHFGFSFFSGGYVGVDIFFVISGYLITKIILIDLEQNDFSLGYFYERRARRILPALGGVIVFSLVFGYIFLLPNNYENLGQSIVAASLFSGNILFWLKVDYFSPSSEIMPFLHTWSLGVEEQFYLVWPLLVLAISRLKDTKKLAIVIGLILVSLIASQLSMNFRGSEDAFYLPHLRAWELLLGCALAMFLQVGQLRLSTVQRNAVSIVALGVLFYCICGYTPETRFPGFAALLPCMATAGLIYVGDKPNRTSSLLLGNQPAAYVGKISYSLYLWHWPVLVFYKLTMSRSPDWNSAVLLIFITWLLSHLSWRYIERPFRFKKDKSVGSLKPLTVALICILIWSAAGLTLHLTNGLPNRLNGEALFYNSFIKYEADRPTDCLTSDVYQQPDYCYVGKEFRHDQPHTLIWGDSHAGHLLPLLSSQLSERNETAVAAIKYGCAPLINLQEYLPKSARRGCTEFNDKIWHTILTSDQIKSVVIAANWSSIESNIQENVKVDSSFRQSVLRVIRKTVVALNKRGIEVVLYGPLPLSETEPTMCLATSAVLDRDAKYCRSPTLAKGSFVEELNQFFAELSHLNGLVHFVDLEAALCENDSCIVEIDGTPLYRDNDHLTYDGVLKLMSLLSKEE